MLKLITATAFVGTFALGATAMAENGAGLRQVSWDQIKQACQNPAAFQSQRQPNAIRLTCEDTQLVWEADQSDSVEMDNQRKISASLSSDKYSVSRLDQSIPMSVSQTSCPRFREVEVSYTKSFSLSCQEIQNFQGNMASFCQGRIDGDLATNKSLATREATGRVYDMCAAPALVSEGGKGQPGTQPGTQPGAGQQPGGKQPGTQPGAQPGAGGRRPILNLPAQPGAGARANTGGMGR
jgi:hypothetical protein